MSEERAVQQVLARYVRGTDARDGVAVAAVFTEDGRVEISYNNSGKSEPLGELVGRDAIAAAVSQMMKPHSARGWSHHKRMTTLLKWRATMDARRSVRGLRGTRQRAASYGMAGGGGRSSGHSDSN